MKRFTVSDRMNRLPRQFFADLAKKAFEATERGVDLINLGQGNPDQPTPEHIVRKLQKAAENPLNHKYPPFHGFRYVKEAIAEFYYREYGVKVEPEKEVALLFGGKGGLVELPQIYAQKGDKVLVPDPGYPDYWSGIALSGADMVMMPLVEENDYLPDYSRLATEDLEAAKMMFLNYPNNPTGGAADKAFFEETVTFARKHDILVCHDFAYGAIGFDGHKPRSFLEAEGAKEVGIEIYTMSKSFNMAGWRIAFAIGNEEVIKALNTYQDHLYCSIFGAIQEAAADAFHYAEQTIPQLNALYEQRHRTWMKALHDIGWKAKPSKGSFFTWLPVPDGIGSNAFAQELLEKVGVSTAPGIGFGEHGEQYLRAALLVEEKRLEEAAERFATLPYFK